ncbi:hypothetical protein [Chitinimonas naiadis]
MWQTVENPECQALCCVRSWARERIDAGIGEGQAVRGKPQFSSWYGRGLRAVVSVALISLAYADSISPAVGAQSFLQYANELADAVPCKPDGVIDAAIGKRFDEALADRYTLDQLKALDEGSLLLLHKAAIKASSASRDAAHIKAQALVLEELARRQLAEPRYYDWLFRSYVDGRMFSEARALQLAHPSNGMERLPEVIDPAGLPGKTPRLWVVDDQQRRLVLQPFVPETLQVIAVVHPNCQFCERAFQAIDADPVLAKALGHHVTWLAPQAGTLDFDLIQQWNRDHPRRRLALAVANQDWPMVDTWATPAFYFLKAGKVVSKVGGWPPEGRRSELLLALKALGMRL